MIRNLRDFVVGYLAGIFLGAAILTILTACFTGHAQESTLRQSLAGGGTVRPQDFGAVGAPNNDTAAFQAAINFCSTQGVAMLVPPGSYQVGNLYMSNNVSIMGYGATIQTNWGMSGYMFEWGSATNAQLYGLTLMGTNPPTVAGGSPANFTYPYSQGNVAGVHLLANSQGSRLEDLVCVGFNDAGIRVFGTEAVTNAPGTPKASLNKVEGVYCFYGCEVLSTDWYVGAAEYVHFNAYQETRCNVGLHITAGNLTFNNCRFNNDNIGAWVDGSVGVNQAHGTFIGCNFNHNAVDSVACNQFNNGELFIGCQFLAQGNIGLTNVSGVRIEGGTMSAGTIYVVGGSSSGPNYIRNSQYYNNGYPAISSISGGQIVIDEQTQSEVPLYGYSATAHFPKPMNGVYWVTTNLPPNGLTFDSYPDG